MMDKDDGKKGDIQYEGQSDYLPQARHSNDSIIICNYRQIQISSINRRNFNPKI